MNIEYAFFANMLMFVADRTPAVDENVGEMIHHLRAMADQVKEGKPIAVKAKDVPLAARGLAGVTALLVDKILPEAAADENEAAVKQITWTSDSCLKLSGLLVQELQNKGEDIDEEETITIDLPPLPS